MGGQKPEDDGEASTVAHLRDQTVPASRDSQTALDLQVGGSIGRYRLDSRIGAGAMGVVWCALDPQLDRRVAIKVLHPNLARSVEASNRLLREARAMAKLSHRAVVTVHDAGEVDGRLFLAMELVEGTTLGQMLRTRTTAERRDWRRWLDMVLTAGRGLEAAHGAGVLHRDFKPDNVLVDTKGRVCVADFGLATLGEDLSQPISERMSKLALELTTTGALLGTPAYMSPQQLRGEAIDARADQFNFCVTTYEALYGRRPFASDGTGLQIIESLEASIERGELLPAPVDSDVPEQVLDVLRLGLAAKAEDRWPDMTSLLAALERAAKLHKRPTRHVSIQEPPPRSRLFMLVGLGAGALAILAVVAMVLMREEKPAARAHVPKKLFDVPLKTRIAITPDGKRMVLASDRIEVRELEGTRTWTSSLPGLNDVSQLTVTNDHVMFGMRGLQSVQRWRYATDSQFESVLESRGAWVGQTTVGHLFYRIGHGVSIHDGTRIVREWPIPKIAELFVISPNKERVAILEADRFSGEIVVRDAARDVELRSSRIENPTALAWQDDRTLLYATGTTENPTIFRMAVTDRFGVPERLYTLDRGWFGELAAAGGRVYFIEMAPKSRARVVDRATQFTRELDASTVGAAMAWTGDDEFLTWHRTTGRIERRTIAGTLVLTEIKLAGEPANATLAGDTVIAAVRGAGGRALVAHSLSTGKRLWSHPPSTMLAIRCADDRQPPCFALRHTGGVDQLVAIDPTTGVTSTTVLHQGAIEDLAVNEAGDRIILAMRTGPMFELSTDGTELAKYPTPFVTVRSVSYDRGEGFLIAGTLVRNTFQVGRLVDGQLTVIAHAENDLLSLVRPSRDGKRVLVHARVYAPVLWELPLP
ncbi:MAG: serine/threonine protein kinase [Myxococcota bacterium]|nr:serine/threonine protein kinase [Myxococcota bacterium]